MNVNQEYSPEEIICLQTTRTRICGQLQNYGEAFPDTVFIV